MGKGQLWAPSSGLGVVMRANATRVRGLSNSTSRPSNIEATNAGTEGGSMHCAGRWCSSTWTPRAWQGCSRAPWSRLAVTQPHCSAVRPRPCLASCCRRHHVQRVAVVERENVDPRQVALAQPRAAAVEVALARQSVRLVGQAGHDDARVGKIANLGPSEAAVAVRGQRRYLKRPCRLAKPGS